MSESAVGKAEVEKDSDFWFFDGNIVLLAQDHVAFRVHQGVLALHSEVFADMFRQSLPVPDGLDADEQFDGCAVIPLGETAYDVRQLLFVIYGMTRFKPVEETTFSVAAALIRMADKYGIHDVVNAYSGHLLRMVPMTLDQYESARAYRSLIKFAPHHAVEALHVFRLVDLGVGDLRVPSFVLFLCAQLSEAEIREGTAREDGTMERLSASLP